jgi:hypothetical protein
VTRSQLKFAKGYRKVSITFNNLYFYFQVPVVTSSKAEEHLVESSQIISILTSYLLLPNRSFKEILNYYPKHETVENGKTVAVYPNKNYIMREDQRLSQDEIQAVR